MSDSWAIVASGAIAAAGAIGGALAGSLAARSSQRRSLQVESARALRLERREAYLQLSQAVAERISALNNLRQEPASSERQEDARASEDLMWRSWRSVRLAGPEDARDAAEALVRHYVDVDDNYHPVPGGSDFERHFVEIGQRALDSDSG